MTEDHPRFAEILSAGVADMDRTFEQKDTGSGHFKVVSVEVVWCSYDPAIDDIAPSKQTITYVP